MPTEKKDGGHGAGDQEEGEGEETSSPPRSISDLHGTLLTFGSSGSGPGLSAPASPGGGGVGRGGRGGGVIGRGGRGVGGIGRRGRSGGGMVVAASTTCRCSVLGRLLAAQGEVAVGVTVTREAEANVLPAYKGLVPIVGSGEGSYGREDVVHGVRWCAELQRKGGGLVGEQR